MKNLDYDEILHLALHAMQQGDHHKALEYLHECHERSSEDANVVFLIAAEHAELGLYDRAIEEMERALELNPDLEIASLQLGLLYSNQNNEEKAQEIWTTLNNKTEEESFKKFSKGFLHLCDRNFDEAVDSLQAGIESNITIPALNETVNNIISYIQGVDNNKPQTDDSGESTPVYLGAYKQTSLDEN